MEIDFSTLDPRSSGPEIHNVAAMEQILIGLVVFALVVVILVRRFSTRRLGSETKMLVVPLAIVVVAVGQGDLVDHRHVLLSEVMLVLGVLLAAGLGAGLGYSLRIWTEADGTRWSKGTKWTVLLLLATLLVRAGLIAAGFALGSPAGMGAILLFLAAWLAAQNGVVYWRSRSLTAANASVAA